MNKIPIVFCFDDNLIMPAGICISSLLMHANENTFYDIFILHDESVKFPSSGYLEKLNEQFQNFNLTYRSVGNSFKDAFQIRGITYATYYRLLIPDLITEYDKIFYFDVDIIFRRDLSSIYLHTDLTDVYVGGVATPVTNLDSYIKTKLQLDPKNYICGGTVIFNSKKMVEDKLVSQFKLMAEKSWTYQDQDVLNIVCKDKIKLLPAWFGIVGTTNEIISDKNQSYYSNEEVYEILTSGIIHYNGAKPWKSWCYSFDIWWEYYRKSVYYDRLFYFKFFHNKLTEYDQLSLWKRVKILLRYFKTKF